MVHRVWPIVCHKMVTFASVFDSQVPSFGYDIASWGPGRSGCTLLELCWKNWPGQDALVLNRGGLEMSSRASVMYETLDRWFIIDP